MSYLENAVMMLDNVGVADVLVPFFLVFTIVYAVLQKTRIFGHEMDRKNINVVVALILGLAVIFPHVTGRYPAQYDVVNIMNQALPQVSLVVVAVIMVLLLIGLFGGESSWIGGSVAGGIALVAFVLVVYIFGAAANIWSYIGWLNWLSDPDTQSLVVVLLVFGLITWFIVKDEKKAPGEGFMKGFGDFFRRPGQ
ncbi:MAG: hypothetical protein NT001_03390 [Candidatus Woesearchaeota archaeon]|nr:hypothetical protein [Candidatus Woesearchaeota archaeon]